MTQELMRLADAYACAPRFDSAGFRAALEAALEAQAAEIERLNKFMDGIKAAVGNQTLEHFIEKHGNPPPLIAERDALQAKLTAMEAQKPVAWMYRMRDGMIDCISPEEHAREEGEYTTPVYAAPVVQQPLMNERIQELSDTIFNDYMKEKFDNLNIAFARAIEAAHGIGGQA